MQVIDNNRPWIDVTKSFFVSASAGSGKTTLLVERILSLLFNGVSPSSILCITYTTAGVGEMKERIENKINEIRQIQSQDEVLKRVSNIIGIDKTKLDIAKINNVLESAISPGGQIEISTFHAFCLKIISLFNVETNINSNFTILDTNLFLQEKIFNEIKTKILTDENLENLRQDILKYMPTSFLERIEEVVEKRKNLEDATQETNRDKTIEAILKCCPSFNNSNINFDKLFKESINLQLPQDIVSKYSKIESNFAKAVEGFKNNTENPLFMFLNKSYEVRKKFVNKDSNIPNDILNQLQQEALKAFDIYAFEVSYKYAKKVSILLELLKHANVFYNQIKQQLGVIDFDDIITKTKELLSDENKAWIAYKLDMHIKHILVDEAQDTNQNQWDIIINGLFADLQHGKGSDDGKSILIVGDEKQMIYSFQGSQFKMLEKIYSTIKQTYNINKVEKNINYRSSPKILAFVDEVFKNDEIQQIYNINVKHISNNINLDGLIEVFDSASADIEKMERKKYNFFEEKEESQKNTILAKQICNKIMQLIQAGINANDIMLLAKSRDDDLFNELLTNFENNNIKISDISKKTIADVACIMSIAYLMRICFVFNDDYAIINLLNSGIFNYSMQCVTDLYIKYKQNSSAYNNFLHFVCQHDENFNNEYEVVKTAAKQLDLQNLLNFLISKYKTYYKQYEQESLSYFFDILQMYQTSIQFSNQTLTVFGFVEYFFANLDFKFSSKNTENPQCIKLSTIHSSKGMESKVVVLIDASKQGSVNKKSIFLSPDGVLNLEITGKEEFLDGGFVENHKEHKLKQSAEDINLLYVALTRAKQILYIFSKDEKGWYNYCQNAIKTMSGGKNFYGNNNLQNFVGEKDFTNEQSNHENDSSTFILQEGSVGFTNRPQKVSYSQLKNDNFTTKDDDNKEDGWLKKSGASYGSAMHKLLEMCKLIKTSDDAKAILLNINYNNNVQQIIEDFFALKTKFVDILTAANARFEVEIASYNTQNNVINIGRVDLLIENDSEIVIYDFKTDKNPQSFISQYKDQLMFYKQILQNQTHKTIKCNIIWTANMTIANIE